jgi:hypothetical protein
VDAFHTAIDMWAEARHQGRNLFIHRFQIKDEGGRILMDLPFAEVLGGAKQPPPIADR